MPALKVHSSPKWWVSMQLLAGILFALLASLVGQCQGPILQTRRGNFSAVMHPRRHGDLVGAHLHGRR